MKRVTANGSNEKSWQAEGRACYDGWPEGSRAGKNRYMVRYPSSSRQSGLQFHARNKLHLSHASSELISSTQDPFVSKANGELA